MGLLNQLWLIDGAISLLLLCLLVRGQNTNSLPSTNTVLEPSSSSQVSFASTAPASATTLPPADPIASMAASSSPTSALESQTSFTSGVATSDSSSHSSVVLSLASSTNLMDSSGPYTAIIASTTASYAAATTGIPDNATNPLSSAAVAPTSTLAELQEPSSSFVVSIAPSAPTPITPTSAVPTPPAPTTTQGIDHCQNNPCENSGNCTSNASGYNCSCALSWTGVNCTEKIDYCAPNPCKNGGICYINLDLPLHYFCNSCKTGWTGENCSADFHECEFTGTCIHGSCSELMGSYKCDCEKGYNGTNCDIDINECETSVNPCPVNSVCANKNGGYDCNCNDGFEKVNGVCKAIILWRDYSTTTYSRQINRTVVTIKTPIPFPYFNGSFRQISGYVNGYVSLGTGSLLPRPPLLSNWPVIPVLLGVYWASMDERQGQNWFYVTEDKTKLDNGSADSSLLAHIRKNVGDDGFEPLYAVAFTWKDAQPKLAANLLNDTATFQVILATDGVLSYAIKNYETLWEKINLADQPVVAPTYTWNGKELVKDLPIKSSSHISVFFENKTSNRDGLKCVQSVQKLLTKVGNDTKLLPACPCNKKQVLEDFRFLINNATKCYDSRFTYETVNHLQQKCCYDSHGLLIKNTKDAGIPLPNGDENILQSCNPAFYEWFFSKYPTSDCSTYKSSVLGYGFGDPHLSTFDGNKFSFQAVGDYVVFKSGEIELQGRTIKSSNANTTYFSEYAFKSPTFNDTFLISAKDNNITGMFKDKDRDSNLTLLADLHSIAIISSSCTVKISEKSGILSHQIYVYSDNFTTVGLMGTRDMNKSNDFLLKSGQLLEGTAYDIDGADVNRFVESWRVNSSDGAQFFSTTASSSSDFQIPVIQNSIERIKEQMNNSQVEEMANELCLDDLYCWQDYNLQRDNASAIETRTESLALNSIIDQMLSQSPIFSNSINDVNINHSVPYSLTLKVDGNKTVQFSKEGFDSVPGLSLANSSFAWDLKLGLTELRNRGYPSTLIFYAVDERNLSTAYKPPINICLCEKTDQCQFSLSSPDDNSGDVNGNVRNVPCDCDERSTGKYCEIKADVCVNCYNKTGCNDTLSNYCPACPAGFFGDGKYCQDIDECAINKGGCEQSCNNTEGSYHCSCSQGYTQNNTACKDINECENEDTCNNNEFEVCINKDGGYDCECWPGRSGPDCIKAPYSYIGTMVFTTIGEQWTPDLLNQSSTKFQTLAGKVITAIESTLNRSSSINSKFYVEVLSFEISSNSTQSIGRRKRETKVDDILVIFILHLSKFVEEEAINMALLEKSNCTSSCSYAGLLIGVKQFPKVNGSVNPCDLPSANRCDMQTSECQSSNQKISCQCKKGFTINAFNPYSCNDIDECKSTANCTKTEFCTNEFGTYSCVCEVGKTWDKNNLSCIPDKCSANPCKHDGICILTTEEPGYACKCTYEWDGSNCEDEDTDARRLRIAVICVSVILGFFCLCLFIILIVVCTKNRRTLDSHAYTNSRYNNGDGLPRPKVKAHGGRSMEMAENGRGGNEYSSLDQDEDKKTSFGRHASGQREKEGGKYFVNKAYENTEVIQERL